MFIFILSVLLSPGGDGMMTVGFLNQFETMKECEDSLQRVGKAMILKAKEDKEFEPKPLKCLQIKVKVPEGQKES